MLLSALSLLRRAYCAILSARLSKLGEGIWHVSSKNQVLNHTVRIGTRLA
jgi:hypothetical protein